MSPVPTGYVPRLTERDKAINKCIDDYLLMERKARAWDRLRTEVLVNDQLTTAASADEVLAWLDGLVQSAQPSAPANR